MRVSRSSLIYGVAAMLILLQTGSVLTAAGTISGTITDASTLAPVSGVSVQVFNANGGFVASAASNASGMYSVSGLVAGSYYVRTSNSLHYINQLHSGLRCVGSCDAREGTPVSVVDPGTTTVNFALTPGGTITGTVRNEALAGLGSVQITIVDAGNAFVSGILTGPTGTYSTAEGIPTGTYYVKTAISSSTPAASQGYINELYNDIPCVLVEIACPLSSAAAVTVTAPAPTAGIDFTLHAGARFAGQVTNAATATGIAGITVDVLNAANQVVSRATADASGNFLSASGLPAGNYYLRTQNGLGFINRFNDGTPCIGRFCSVTGIAPISASDGVTVAGINLALSAGAQFSGTITDAATGAALSGVQVDVLSSAGSQITFGTSNTGGLFTTRDGLPPGTYFLRATSFDGYITELFENVACVPSCTVGLGTPLVVAGPGVIGGQDFALTKGAQFTGVVSAAGTGQPLGGVFVFVVNATGTSLTGGFTNANGRYTTDQGLLDGSYYLRTSNTRGLINEVYPNINCIGFACPNGVGTAISATAATSPVAVDMDLAVGGLIAGTVKHAGAPIPGASVSVLDSTGASVTSGTVDAVGAYVTGAGLPTGSYYVRTFNSVGYINEVFDNALCVTTCNLAAATPVGVTSPSTTPGIDFDLALGGRITGIVTASGSPLAGVTVQMFSPALNTTFSAITDANGVYAVTGLVDGTYYARTSNNAGFINEAYDDLPCVNVCSSNTLGTPIVVTGANTVSGINFDLAAGGRIAGSITESGVPIAGVTVTILDASGFSAASATTDFFGNYVSGAGLATGTYFARTSNSQGYLNELYDNVACPLSCTLITGTPISVTTGATTSGVSFDLARGGRVSGVIIDAATNAPISSVTVQVYDAGGRIAATAFTDATGTYLTGTGLPPGTYFAKTSNSAGYQDLLFNGKTCPLGCSVLTGDSFSVGSGVTNGIDFALTKGGRVSGSVVDAATSQPIGGVTVQIVDPTGKLVATGFTNSFGVYTTSTGLPTGTYYARTSNSLGYLNQLYSGLPCLGSCIVTSGTPFVVTSPSTTTGIDFSLILGGRISGTIRDAATSAPLTNVSVFVFDSAGVFSSSATTNALGQYLTTTGLPTGSYTVVTSNSQGLINKVFNDIECLGCDPSIGSPVAVTTGSTTSGIDFQLAHGARVTGTVTRNGPGTFLSNVTVSIWNGSGIRVASGVTDGSGIYATSGGLPTGTYYARTENSLGLVNKIYFDIACSSMCDPSSGTPIALAAPATTSGIDFALDPDADTDADGIVNTIDTLPATFSNDFSDVAQGGTTAGTVTNRDTWSVAVGDVSPGGVQVAISNTGASAATFDTCPAGGAERLSLDVAGETALVSCTPGTGSTTARAIVASPVIELADSPSGGGLLVLLTTAQGATIGSPVMASPTNTEPITVKILDANNSPIGSFDLDPGESVDAAVTADASVTVTVISGTVNVTVRDTSVTLSTGQTNTFPPATFTFTGFLRPLSNPPSINRVVAGKTVPIKFSLGGDFGRDILAPSSPRSQAFDCTTGAPIGTPLPAASTGLQFVNGSYVYSWKTEKSWGGSCRQFVLELSDGTLHTALFQFK